LLLPVEMGKFGNYNCRYDIFRVNLSFLSVDVQCLGHISLSQINVGFHLFI